MPTMPSDPGFDELDMQLDHIVGMSISDITKEAQTVDYGVGQWKATAVLPRMSDSESRPWRGFINSLRGKLNTFQMPDPDRAAPLGTGNGTPLVNGASQTGNSLITDGWANGEVVLKAGDLFQVGNYFYEIESDVTSDGSGNATLTFNPALKAAPSDNDSITVNDCSTKMRLTSNATSVIVSNVGNVRITLNFEEAI